ncbi:hypothetical protein C8P68_102336 [Mucilaginibacter yixingensis]|uniref:Signal peptidase I n=1 Tax=Mucilaginibacter yixingensis TaxID=1295612 RepID=A0A2T5JCM7_9SPHI|nr:DUF5684 domain-containing protein [Mucilaginibacter yixingensis]PTQ99512.1 hypothetical protein C8P68_102336 [Mucilaginibacter yixingensis]
METYDSSAGTAVAAGAIVMFIVIMLLWVLIPIVGMWKAFSKAGKPGWAAIIPIYNYIVMLEITGKPLWWCILMLFPCTSLIFVVWNTNLISKSFGKSEGFTVGLFFLPFIFWPILGFGDAQYLGPSAKEAMAANRFGSADYQRPFDNNAQ